MAVHALQGGCQVDPAFCLPHFQWFELKSESKGLGVTLFMHFPHLYILGKSPTKFGPTALTSDPAIHS